MKLFKFYLLLFLSVSLCSCGPELYVPAPINITGIKKKNDINLHLRYSNVVNIGAAYSPVDHFFVLVNHNIISQEPSTELFGSTIGFDIGYTNFGIGYYQNLGNHFFVEGQSSLGFGKYKLYRESEKLQTSIRVVENNLALYLNLRFIDIGGAMQYKRYLFSDDTRGDITLRNGSYAQRINENIATTLFEYSLFTKLRIKHLEIEIQVGQSNNLTLESTGIFDQATGSVGFSLRI